MRSKLSDVARKAGVSLATASSALRGVGRVSAATADNVRRAAAELGYHPDATAQALAKGATRRSSFHGTIGMLFTAEELARIAVRARPPQRSFFEALPETAAALGYALDMFKLPATVREADVLARTLKARGIRGLVVRLDNDVMPDCGFPWDDFTIILSGCTSPDMRFNQIQTHSFNNAYAAVHQGFARGYRSFGLAMSTAQFPDWLGGFAAATHRLGVTDGAAVFDLPQWDEAAFVAWYEKTRPGMVIANHGASPVDALARRGVVAPRDYGFFALDLNEVRAGIAGWRQHHEEGNRLAIEMLHALLRRGESGRAPAPFFMDIAGEWVEGETLRTAPGAK